MTCRTTAIVFGNPISCFDLLDLHSTVIILDLVFQVKRRFFVNCNLSNVLENKRTCGHMKLIHVWHEPRIHWYLVCCQPSLYCSGSICHRPSQRGTQVLISLCMESFFAWPLAQFLQLFAPDMTDTGILGTQQIPDQLLIISHATIHASSSLISMLSLPSYSCIRNSVPTGNHATAKSRIPLS